MKLSHSQIDEHLEAMEKELLDHNLEISVQLERSWARQFSPEAGVYIIRENGQICYVGETGSLMSRMTDLVDTRNHVIRRNIGNENFSELKGFSKATSKIKFPSHIENLVEDWIVTKLKVSMIQVDLGRKELEEKLFLKYKPKYNKKGKRTSKLKQLNSDSH